MKVMYSTWTGVHGFNISPASSAGKTDATLLVNNSQHCSMLQVRLFAHPVDCCCVLLGVVALKLKLVKRLATGNQFWDLLRPFYRALDLSFHTTFLIAPVFAVSFL